MIARVWKGAVRRADTPRNRGAWMLRRGESTATHYEIADAVQPRSGR